VTKREQASNFCLHLSFLRIVLLYFNLTDTTTTATTTTTTTTTAIITETCWDGMVLVVSCLLLFMNTVAALVAK
jgi:hypothetical protein